MHRRPFKGTPMNRMTEHQDDVLVRALACGGTVRALAVRSTEVARTLSARHEASPLGTVAASRVATAALLMGGLLKGREQVGLQLKGDGPLGAVYAIANADGDVRVSIDEPTLDLPPGPDGRWPLPQALGLGRMTVTRSLGLKEPYVGVVPMVTGEVAEDLAHYFEASEQKPAAVGISEVLGPDGVRMAGGFLVQGLPGADPAALDEIARRIEALPALSRLFAEGVGPEALLARIFDELVVLESYPVRMTCPCDRGRFEALLATMGSAELHALAEEKPTTEVICHFCNTRYFFSPDELRALAAAQPGR